MTVLLWYISVRLIPLWVQFNVQEYPYARDLLLVIPLLYIVIPELISCC